MHSFVLAVVRLGDASLGGNVDDDDRLRTLRQLANGNLLSARNALN